MGSPADEVGRRDDETPHQVRISHGYYMAVTVVSQEQYKNVTGESPAAFKNRNLPVERVTYADAVAFCQQLTQRENGFLARLKHRGGPRRAYRLPSEAEWEYACRCGQQWPYAFGRRIGPERVNFDARSPCPGDPPGKYRGSTNFVTRFKPNPWGLIDMHGNVLEWCGDWYGDYPTQSILNPVGPSRGTWRVARGGSWHHGASDCRCAARFRVDAAQSVNYLGFRVVMELAQ
jgi:formylglycine-generating enzyme required for sulfatase activity